MNDILPENKFELIDMTNNLIVTDKISAQAGDYIDIRTEIDFKLFTIIICYTGDNKDIEKSIEATIGNNNFDLYNELRDDCINLKELKKLYKTIGFKSTSLINFKKYIKCILDNSSNF